jgi:hypothetical protein
MLPEFPATVRALITTVAEREAGATGSAEAAGDFVLASLASSPSYLRASLRAATLLFGASSLLWSGCPFHRLAPAQRRTQVEAWEASALGPMRMLMRFYVSLALISLWAAEGHHE